MAQKKIEEWIKEIEERPSSAPLILNYIAGRLQELTNRNEELLAEVIALQSGNKVEEYERKIAHLEYQLELLKSGLAGASIEDDQNPANHPYPRKSDTAKQYLIIYAPDGRVLCISLPSSKLNHGDNFATIAELPFFSAEPPRMITVGAAEELLFLFTTGRIATLPISSIQAAADISDHTEPDKMLSVSWRQAGLPSPLRTSESLACILPISEISLADFFVQVSRRGFLKKIRIGMADGILQNRYIGMGIHKPPDRTFELLLCRNSDQVALVTWEGSIAIFDVKDLPVSLGQVSRLSSTDHLVRVMTVDADKSILVMTNVGKIIHLTEERLQSSATVPTKGATLFSTRRREEGVRVVDAVCVTKENSCCVLDEAGNLSAFNVERLSGSGTLEPSRDVLAFCRLPDRKSTE